MYLWNYHVRWVLVVPDSYEISLKTRKIVLKSIILFNLCKYNTLIKLIFKKINELYVLGWTKDTEQ